MPEKKITSFDVLIVGSGFAGSLTALVLHSLGLNVCLVEKGQHPRFAIGESSTPIADMILRSLSEKYDLPWLTDFSRYGSWQQTHPEIVCGLKRGFSFFKHYTGREFSTDNNHKSELFVAASVNDDQSDTNWLRADFDNFLINKAKETGITYIDLVDIISLTHITEQWELLAKRKQETITFRTSFLIDATGSGAFSERFLTTKSFSTSFLTNSYAVYSHFLNVPFWSDVLRQENISTNDYPFTPDHSASHHILDEGWLWDLRFNDERTSMGLVLDGQKEIAKGASAEMIWESVLTKYPTIYNNIILPARLANVPGQLIRSGRLQRRLERCFGEGWLALPNTAGFVDPLFSTGIAHSLSGIEEIASIFSASPIGSKDFYHGLKVYEQSVFQEIELIDQLISGCYKSFETFELFNAWSMLFFAITISYEQKRLKNQMNGYFPDATDLYIKEIVLTLYNELMDIISKPQVSETALFNFSENILKKIGPVNTANLLDHTCKNMYHHSAAEF